MKRHVLRGVLGLAAILLVIDLTRDDSAEPAAGADSGMPLRIELSLVERARAAAPQPPVSGTEPVSEALRLRADTQMQTQPAPEPEAPAEATQGKAALAEEAPAARPPLPPGSVRLDLLSRARVIGQTEEAGDPFGPKSWVIVPPPPPPPPPAPVEAPRAPPLPFRFMGQLDDGRGSRTFFLARGTAMISVGLGETIDNTYLLERIEGGALQFTYLPLRERQTLQIGAGP